MLTTDQHLTRLYILCILGFACLTGATAAVAFSLTGMRDRVRRVADTLAAPEPSTTEEDLWALLHPCGVSLNEYGARPKPDEASCTAFNNHVIKQAHARKFEQEQERLHDILRLTDCIAEPVDTVNQPNGYWTSWVLNGSCAMIAEDMRTIQSSGLCWEFRQDDYLSAVDCQEQLYSHLFKLCVPGHAKDRPRDCLRTREIIDRDWNEGSRRDQTVVRDGDERITGVIK